jgi:hypothetical protein
MWPRASRRTAIVMILISRQDALRKKGRSLDRRVVARFYARDPEEIV